MRALRVLKDLAFADKVLKTTVDGKNQKLLDEFSAERAKESAGDEAKEKADAQEQVSVCVCVCVLLSLPLTLSPDISLFFLSPWRQSLRPIEDPTSLSVDWRGLEQTPHRSLPSSLSLYSLYIPLFFSLRVGVSVASLPLSPAPAIGDKVLKTTVDGKNQKLLDEFSAERAKESAGGEAKEKADAQEQVRVCVLLSLPR